MLDVTAILASGLPGYRVHSVTLLGAGLDNRAYEVNGELIVRFSNEPDPAVRTARVSRESRLLAAVAEVSPVPVPVPVFTAPDVGCLAYRKLAGVPLLDLPGRTEHVAAIAGPLGDLLAALHTTPPGHWTGLVDTDVEPMADWRRDAVEIYQAVAVHVPAAHRPSIERFLDTAPPPDDAATVFSHNDLGIEHVLVDPVTWAVTGVIDWSDAAIVDPAYDYGLLYRDLGPAAPPAADHERAVFYARCAVFEDLAFGLDTGRPRYVDKSIDAMAWLFPVGPGYDIGDHLYTGGRVRRRQGHHHPESARVPEEGPSAQ